MLYLPFNTEEYKIGNVWDTFLWFHDEEMSGLYI